MLICRHVVDYNACCCGLNIAYARSHFAVPPPAGARCAVLVASGRCGRGAGCLCLGDVCARLANRAGSGALDNHRSEPLRIRRSVCAYEGSVAAGTAAATVYDASGCGGDAMD